MPDFLRNPKERYAAYQAEQAQAADKSTYERLHTYDVKAHGATGDGTTDDTTAVQNAINAAQAAGQVCYFPAGTYLCGPLTIPQGAVLRGVNAQGYSLTTASPTLSIIKLKTGSVAPLISPHDVGATYANDVAIFDIYFHGNNVNQPLLNIPDATLPGTDRDWLIERCYFDPYLTTATGSGSVIYIGNVNRGCVMRDCTISNYNAVGYNAVGGYNGLYWYGSDGLCERVWVSNFANAGVTFAGGNNSYCQTFHQGGSFWNHTNIVVAGGNVILDSAQFNYSYTDSLYVAQGPLTVVNCTFFSSSLTTTNTWCHINVNGTGTQVTLIGNMFTPEDLAINANLPKYFIGDNGTGSVIKEFGNSQMGNAHYGTAYRNYVPASPQINSYLAASTATSGNLASVTLPPGTWLITGRMSLYYGSTSVAVTAWLSPNSNSQTGQYDCQQTKVGNTSGGVTNSQLIVTTVQTFTSTTTVYLSATLNSATALAVATGTDGHSTGIQAVPINAALS